MKRRLPKSINVALSQTMTVKEIENTPLLKDIIFNESYEAIKDSVANTKNTATLFEINNSGYILELGEQDWIPALEKGTSFWENKEEFEKCALYKTLINQIYERRSKQDNTSSKQHSKRKNSSKKKKEE